METANSRFSVITPTGDRPEAFSICTKLMEKQTLKPTEWIIVDDGRGQSQIPNFPFVKYLKRHRLSTELSHTLPIQLQRAMREVITDKVIIMEDDDWYHPDYLKRISVVLNAFELVGQTHNSYYYIKDRQYFTHQNVIHSSLCSTAFTKSIFSFFNHIKLSYPYVDLKLWKLLRIKKCLYYPSEIMVLGMKQLPGRTGITYNSNRTVLKCGIKNDINLKFLGGIVKDDIKLYLPFIGQGLEK